MATTHFLNRCRRGFTLLEVLVAVAVIAIVSTAVYQMHLFSISESYRGRLEAQCFLLAQKKIAEIEAVPPETLISGTGDFGEAFRDFRWELRVEETESDRLKTAGKDLKRIDLRVFSDPGPVEYAIRIYRFFR